jgi:hypothetical protein
MRDWKVKLLILEEELQAYMARIELRESEVKSYRVWKVASSVSIFSVDRNLDRSTSIDPP